MGKYLFGYAADDSHSLDGIGNAFVVVNALDKTVPHLLRALKIGNFYCSTGTAIKELSRHGLQVSIRLEEKGQVDVVGSQGRGLQGVVCNSLELVL